jgi:CRISPR/Cas system-associated protein Cas7 (RAMP superfamily)
VRTHKLGVRMRANSSKLENLESLGNQTKHSICFVYYIGLERPVNIVVNRKC